MDLYFEISGNQIDGARDYQEDAFLTTYLDDDSGHAKSSALVIVADGMGGHAAGNIASHLVVSTFNKWVTGHFGKQDLSTTLREALAISNDSLKASIRETPALDGMGCTMVTAAFTKGKVWWISVGDSHLYLLRDRELLKKNEDHSYGGYLDRMQKQGLNVEPEPGLSRNMLMSALTGDEIAEIDCPKDGLVLLPGDRIIIATDGVDTLSAGAMIQYSAWAKNAKECVESFLNAVEEAGKPRQDNTTVVVIDVMERGAVRDQEEEAPSGALGDTQPLDAAELQAAKASMGQTQPFAAGEIKAAMDAAAPEPTAEVREPEESAPKAPSAQAAAPEQAAEAPVEEPEIEAPSLDELISEEPAPAREPPARGGRFEAPPTELPARKKGKGLLIGLAVVVLLALGAGGYYMLVIRGPAQQPPPVATAPAVPPPAVAVPEPEIPAPAPEATEPAPPVDVPKAEPKPEPATVPAAARSVEFRDALKSGGTGPAMVKIPAGSFRMGSGSLSVNADERPQHNVRVKSFAVSKYEITFTEYERFAAAAGRKIPDNVFYMEKDTHPVLFVSWDDAYEYARWLSQETGKTYRLLSEAEWEYMAGAGAKTPYWWGFDVGKNRAHCRGCETGLDPREPTRVGRFKPNPFGVYDTHGNVMEWVYDCYHKNYVGAPDDGSVWEGGDCAYRIARGGSYHNAPPSIRTQKRHKLRSTTGYDTVGIRIARDL